MIVTMKNQINQMIRQAASVIENHEIAIRTEWDHILQRIRDNKTLIDCGEECPEQLQSIIDLFWEYIPGFVHHDIEATFMQMQKSWSEQSDTPMNAHKLILLFTMLENAVQSTTGKDNATDYKTHQSIRHFFSLIAQRFFAKSTLEMLNVDKFVQQLFQKPENPFLWAAKIQSQDGTYQITEYIPNQSLTVDSTWKKMLLSLQGPSLNLLADALLRLINHNSQVKELDVFPLTIGEDTYLFCIPKADAESIKPFFTLSLQLLQQNENVYNMMQLKNDWKDSLILFDEWIMLARHFEEAIEKVVSGFVNYLPFKRAALFYYAEQDNGDEFGVGVIGHQFNTGDIRNIKENLRTLPKIKKPMQRFQALYVPKAEDILPQKFIKQFELQSLVVAPIYSASNKKVWGGVFLDQGEGKPFEVSSTIMSVITKFGQHAGEVLAKYSDFADGSLKDMKKIALTTRETEIMKLMAEGKTIDEAADILYLSKYTVRDYISDIMRKMEASNRTHAIAMAIRQGLI